MSDHSRIQELLEETLESGRPPEEVCAACSELLPYVIEQLRRYRAIEAQIDTLFPSSSEGMAVRRRQLISGNEPLPQIASYHVDAVLGRGGVGVVYQANHLKLNRYVALKMLLSGAYANPNELVRFKREAEAVASLRHAHIVQIYDVGDHNGNPYFTMEILDGGNLAQKLDSVPQPAMATAALMTTLASAIHAAHLGGIVHRDLKPSNILFADDGTPKITDFGLARRLGGNTNITESGDRVGTPSYMAPEQALGKISEIGPATDIYGLGAILYEMLTGRPPFRGESSSDTERQVISQEPVPPSRLNPRVPRDLETICLKCLQKDPLHRYASAADLAADLGRFQRGVSILARPAGVAQRVAKWVRRHPTATVATVSSLCLLIAVISAAVWFTSQRAATTLLVERDLQDVSLQSRRFAWSEARASLERARARISNSGAASLRARIDLLDRELKLVTRLETIKLVRAGDATLVVNMGASGNDYAAAFRDSGIGAIGDVPEVVAQRIRAMDIRPVLIGALDDWALCTNMPNELAWLTQVAHIADGSPTDWRASARDPNVWSNRDAMAAMVDEVTRAMTLDHPSDHETAGNHSVALLVTLGQRFLQSLGRDAAIPFMERVQRSCPDDFWANLWLGQCLRAEKRPAEAARFFQAAVALRPDAAMARANLGEALAEIGRPDEAIEQFRMALRLRPNWFRPQFDMGVTLGQLGRHEDALVEFEKAMRVAPDAETLNAWPIVKRDLAVLHGWMGKSTASLGRHAEATIHFGNALLLDPTSSPAMHGLRRVKIAQRKWPEVIAGWGALLEKDPSVAHEQWDGFGELCLFAKDEAQYRRVRQMLLVRFNSTADPNVAERTGRTCLLMAGTEEEMRQATALIDRALADTNASKFRPYFLFAKALAEYRLGRFEYSLALLKGEAAGVLHPGPLLLLAMCHERLGSQSDALSALASAAIAFDWSEAAADGTERWMHHVLRREAESRLLPNLSAFLAGQYTPTNSYERLALTAVCQAQGRHVARAQLWADTLAALPAWETQFRQFAVPAAAAAGSAEGSDTVNLTDAERAQWRARSRDWMRSELAAVEAALTEGKPGRERVHRTLSTWLISPDLAGVREKDALERLPVTEREQWMVMWNELASARNRVQDSR